MTPGRFTILHAAETIKGGIATVMRHLVHAQAASPEVAAVHCLVPSAHAGDLPRIDGVAMHVFERTGRDIASLMRFLRAFTQLVREEKPDIVHLHSSFAGLLGRIAVALHCRGRYRPRVVYCPHAFSFLMHASTVRRACYGWVERMLARLTHRIICVSRDEMKSAVEHGLPAKKLTLVHNGVPATPAARTRTVTRSSHGIQILYVGRFDQQKGFDVLLEAMHRLEGEPFHLTAVGGPVNDSTVPPVRPNITYAGWLDPDAMSLVFELADLIVVPSRWEGFAMVPLEAMSHGLPVVASHCSSLPEVVVDGVTGLLFPAGDSEALVRCIRSRSRLQWYEMGQRALIEQQARFSDAAMSNATMQIYRDLLDRVKRPNGVGPDDIDAERT